MSGATARDRLSLDVTVRYARFRLEVAAELPLQGITAVFGPSGGGKSTLLRALAGLTPATGSIVLGPTTLLDSSIDLCVPPHRRALGVAFQDARLFPHLDVRGNLRFAWRRTPRALRDESRWQEVIDAFDLAALLDRRSPTLSGGERQRVSLARTLLTLPRLLLLDEPLSALDAARKADILPYIERITARFGLPVLYVTHAIDEVARLADRVLVLAGGRVQALGPAARILERVDLQPLTGHFEAGALIETTVVGHDPELALTRLDLDGQSVVMPALEHLPAGRRIRLRVRARDVALATRRPEGISIRNVLHGRLLTLEVPSDSPFAEALVNVGHQRLRARLTRAAVRELALAPGQEVFVLLKSVSFDRRALHPVATPS